MNKEQKAGVGTMIPTPCFYIGVYGKARVCCFHKDVFVFLLKKQSNGIKTT